MDLALYPTISEPIKLADISPAFKSLEDQQLDGLPDEERDAKRV